MKKYFFIALAAIAALSSCAKESLVSNDENGKEAQVFTATMEDGITTKVTFDATNKCAFWEVGDAISIDGYTYTAEQAGASSTFTGSGATESKHHAYFPANLYNGGTPTLPAELAYAEGKFNMPMYAQSTTQTLSFKNICAVLAIKVTSADITALKSIKVKADKKLNGKFTVNSTTDGGYKAEIATDDTDGTNEVVLSMGETAINLTTDGTTFYIAIPAQDYSYLKIYLSGNDNLYKKAMITKKAAGLTIACNTIYNIAYETNAVQMYAGGPYWSTCNIGAHSPTEYGWYFSWGNTTGYVYDNTNKWVKASDNTTKLGTDGSFSIPNYDNTAVSGNGNTLTGDIPVGAEFDAAYANWGAGWRMPTGNEGEFKALYDNTTSDWIDDYNSTRVKGRTFTGKTGTLDYSDALLFFPAAGGGSTTFLSSESFNGIYWSSTCNESNAYFLRFDNSKVYPPTSISCHYGYPVRPLSD